MRAADSGSLERKSRTSQVTFSRSLFRCDRILSLFIQVGVESESCCTDGEVMLIDPSDGPETLTEYDFPKHYVKKQHPLDYVPAAEPIEPEYINHRAGFQNHRLILRISWKAGDSYIPMSFLLDFNTRNICLSSKAYRAMSEHGLIEVQDEYVPYVRIHTGPSESFTVRCEVSPGWCKSTNTIGLVALRRLGFHLSDVHPQGFSFDKTIRFF